MQAPPPVESPALPQPPIGGRITVAGRQLFVYRSGTGGPAVVILPGAGAMALDYLNIQEGAARLTTSVLYDRAGTGWSGPVELPRSATEVTTELRELLRAAGVPAPYVFVGHSLGGGYAWHYAQRFPGEVAGLLLLDPLHADSPKYWPEETRQGGEQLKAMAKMEPPPQMIEAYRALFQQKFQSWPDQVREPLVTRHLEAWRAGIFEAMSLDTVVAELGRGGPIPDVPLVVITAMGIDPAQRAMGAPDALQQKINDGKRTHNDLIARTTPGGRNVVLEDAAHAWMTMDRPDAVLKALEELLEAVRRR
jgi:pimeloyl-ACP methyl ester carboxylesterase